jgi:hypothetical protein
MQLPLTGPLFFFGQVGAEGESPVARAPKVDSKTGVGCKLPLPAGVELTLRTGPAVMWTAPTQQPTSGPLSTPPTRPAERSPLFVEMSCRLPLLGEAGLEYVGSAFPALDPTIHDQLKQDLRIVLPLGADWQLRFGAKHSWENVRETLPSSTGLQFYMGSGMKW